MHKHTFDCGCIVAIDYDKSRKIIYCAKHEAANKMLKALEAVNNSNSYWWQEVGTEVMNAVENAIKLAKGPQDVKDQKATPTQTEPKNKRAPTT